MTGASPAEAGFSRRMPAALLALLVAVRLAAVAIQPLLAERVPDWAWANNDGYDALAANWLATGAFSLDPGVPTALRLPLYPALLALARLAAGPAYVWATMLLQAALSVATGVVLFRLAAELFGRRVAAWTVVLFVVHPQVNNFVVRCATETLFTFLAAAFALAATRFARDRRGRDLVGAAAWLGLSLLTRPTLAALAWLGLASLLAWSWAGRRDALRRLGW
ncbi:MAG TPA: glycosyltransferase family 39 protein, partial [Kiritimatiellia bacterium]|nr:glycosyltransferase family 39 protein [Kiritimatiellia bacterium]